MIDDPSNGYEAVAPEFIAGRGTRPTRGDAIGVARVRAWAETLPSGATVLDLGCGPGEPMTRVLRDAGLMVYGVDASPPMAAAFRDLGGCSSSSSRRLRRSSSRRWRGPSCLAAVSSSRRPGSPSVGSTP